MVNEFTAWVDYGDSYLYYLFELSNYFWCVILVVFAHQLKLISDRALWVWVIAFASPFIFNYVIFSPTLYGDQYIYTFEVVELAFDRQRIPGSNLWGGYNSTGYMAGYLLSFIPIPALATLTSLGFANRILAFIFYIWLSKIEHVSEKAILALCLIPSFVLYTSLSLREALILIPATVILISNLRGKYLPMLIMLPLLYVLKFQVFTFIAIYLVSTILLRTHKSMFMFVLFVCTAFIGLFIFEEQILEIINLYRLAFVAEDFENGYAGFGLYGLSNEFADINSTLDAIIESLKGIPVLLFIPLPWNWEGVLYAIQFFESVGLIVAFFYIIKKYSLLKVQAFYPLIFSFGVAFGLYALLVQNEGTFVRYRFEIVFPWMVALYYLGVSSASQLRDASKESS
ncbi:hypothetical protein N9L56_00220 [Gammaproteobacteria bacterium]|nr:hypothetical protein [Gammaproteobacteria bacterium]